MGLPQRADADGELVPARVAGVVFRSLAEQPQLSCTDRLREAFQLVRGVRRVRALLRAQRSKTLDERRARRDGFFDDFAQLNRIVAKNRPQPLDIEDVWVYAAASS